MSDMFVEGSYANKAKMRKSLPTCFQEVTIGLRKSTDF